MKNTPTLDHVAIAVESIEAALKVYQAIGCEVGKRERVKDQDVDVQFLESGECHIELLEPLSKEGPVGKFLEKKGPGLHHICVRVSDIRGALKTLKAKGFHLINENPVVGAGNCLVAFIHPKSSSGTLIELKEVK